MSILRKLAAEALALYRSEPVLVYTYAASAIVAAASLAGVVVNQQSVLHVIETVIPILVGGHLARGRVTPV